MVVRLCGLHRFPFGGERTKLPERVPERVAAAEIVINYNSGEVSLILAGGLHRIPPAAERAVNGPEIWLPKPGNHR